MPILQFKCHDCLSVFEYLFNALSRQEDLSCVSCGGNHFSRLDETCFYPNKAFCPRDKVLDTEGLRSDLSKIVKDRTLRCGGCGSGNCGSGACGSGGSCSGKKNSLVTFVNHVLN